MLATQGALPDGTGWAFEFKWDGVRAISYVHDTVHAFSRNDHDITATYPELSVLSELTAGLSVVLDGEIVALDGNARPSFARLQSRMHVQEPSPDLLRHTPIVYYIFDVLHVDGHDTTNLPYLDRRELLDKLELTEYPQVVQVPPSIVDVPGHDVLASAAENGLEGVVAKRIDSRYEPGRRSTAWIKVPLLNTQEVVIGGWRPGAGRRLSTLGSLLVGAYSAGEFVYLGHVGTGFTDAALRDLRGRLEQLSRPESPFARPIPKEHAKDAHWVHPQLVGEVEYRQVTTDGLLRHASWRGLRSDKDVYQLRGNDAGF